MALPIWPMTETQIGQAINHAHVLIQQFKFSKAIYNYIKSNNKNILDLQWHSRCLWKEMFEMYNWFQSRYQPMPTMMMQSFQHEVKYPFPTDIHIYTEFWCT